LSGCHIGVGAAHAVTADTITAKTGVALSNRISRSFHGSKEVMTLFPFPNDVRERIRPGCDEPFPAQAQATAHYTMKSTFFL
jgi:hypothetical protein